MDSNILYDPIRKKYSLCFIFNEYKDQVLLIQKTKPDWQAGKLNGIGGKFEFGESIMDCTVREVFEETDIQLNHDELNYIGFFDSEKYIVYITTACINDERFYNHKQKTNEKLFIYDIEEIMGLDNILPSARTALVAALQTYVDDTVISFSQIYN